MEIDPLAGTERELRFVIYHNKRYQLCVRRIIFDGSHRHRKQRILRLRCRVGRDVRLRRFAVRVGEHTDRFPLETHPAQRREPAHLVFATKGEKGNGGEEFWKRARFGWASIAVVVGVGGNERCAGWCGIVGYYIFYYTFLLS